MGKTHTRKKFFFRILSNFSLLQKVAKRQIFFVVCLFPLLSHWLWIRKIKRKNKKRFCWMNSKIFRCPCCFDFGNFEPFFQNFSSFLITKFFPNQVQMVGEKIKNKIIKNFVKFSFKNYEENKEVSIQLTTAIAKSYDAFEKVSLLTLENILKTFWKSFLVVDHFVQIVLCGLEQIGEFNRKTFVLNCSRLSFWLCGPNRLVNSTAKNIRSPLCSDCPCADLNRWVDELREKILSFSFFGCWSLCSDCPCADLNRLVNSTAKVFVLHFVLIVPVRTWAVIVLLSGSEW